MGTEVAVLGDYEDEAGTRWAPDCILALALNAQIYDIANGVLCESLAD